MQNILFQYGQEIAKKYKNERKFLKLDNLLEPIDLREIIHSLKIPHTHYEIVKRFHTDDQYNIKWHIDNQQLQKHKIENSTHDLNIIYQNEKYKYGLWTQGNNLPTYTAIIYLSSNFEGGEFCFVDYSIKPQKGDVIIFNSKEVHKVNPLKSGTRNCYVIKFYGVPPPCDGFS